MRIIKDNVIGEEREFFEIVRPDVVGYFYGFFVGFVKDFFFFFNIAFRIFFPCQFSINRNPHLTIWGGLHSLTNSPYRHSILHP